MMTTYEVNIDEFMAMAGYPSDQKNSCAISIGAQLEIAVRETTLAEAQEQMASVREWATWWYTQRESWEIRHLFEFDPDKKQSLRQFIDKRQRECDMLCWMAENILKVVEAGDYKMPAYLNMDRKALGAYYTPKSLVDELIKSALDPVIARALGREKLADAKN